MLSTVSPVRVCKIRFAPGGTSGLPLDGSEVPRGPRHLYERGLSSELRRDLRLRQESFPEKLDLRHPVAPLPGLVRGAVVEPIGKGKMLDLRERELEVVEILPPHDGR